MKQIISTKEAPLAFGTYSQAVKVGNLTFVSGQLPVSSKTGKIVKGDIKNQTKQSLENIQSVLEECGLAMTDVVKTTVYLSDMLNYAGMNEVYNKYFISDFPARAALAVKELPKDALVEIDAIAMK